MKISYAITVCNEFVEIQRLVSFLLQKKRYQDQIVILFDEANGDPEIEQYLRTHSINGEFVWHKGAFNKHFADWKNLLTLYCTGDYIFQIDADELPSETLLVNIKYLIENNEGIQRFVLQWEDKPCIIYNKEYDELISKYNWSYHKDTGYVYTHKFNNNKFIL